MTSNCLITKLKGVIDNPNLDVLGQMETIITSQWTNEQLNIVSSNYTVDEPLKLTLSDGYFTYNNGTSIGNTLLLTDSDTQWYRIYTNSNTCKLTINNYYMIKKIVFPIMKKDDFNPGLDLKRMTYCSNLIELSSGVFGNIENLKNSTNLTKLYCGTANVSGDVKKLISEIAQIRTSGTMNMYFGGTTSVTFNGKHPDRFYTRIEYFTWESPSKMYSINQDNTDVYTYGYSDEEISTKTASGGEWEGKTIVKCD